jgi:hypothetical protein
MDDSHTATAGTHIAAGVSHDDAGGPDDTCALCRFEEDVARMQERVVAAVQGRRPRFGYRPLPTAQTTGRDALCPGDVP